MTPAPVLCPHCENTLPTGTLNCPSCGAAAGPKTVAGEGAFPAVPGYEVLGVLGRGGMGVVYRARQVGLNRPVALKMILHAEHAALEGRQRFLREAEAIARLRHPNIVQVHEVGEHRPAGGGPAVPFFSMELCDGGSLEDRLQEAPLTPAAAAALVQILARAVQHAHEQGVVHRDLKPANVLLTPEGLPKVSDFGLAKRVGEARQTASGAVVGPPSYMAPEQAAGKGRDIDARTDVYSLGAILYECLTGRPPFKADTAAETLVQVLADEPVSPHRLLPKVPRDLDTICLKCLEKEPRKRYASASALADDLRRFLAGEPITARPVGVAERALKWVRRRPAVAGLLALVVVVTATGLALVAFQWRRAEERRRDAEEQRPLAQQAQVQAETEADNARRRKEEAERAGKRAKEGEEEAKLAQKKEAEERKRADHNSKLEQQARLKANQARQETEQALNATRHALASSRVTQAQYALRDQNLSLARELLRKCAPDARHWDWNHLRLITDGGEHVFHDLHTWAALSPDGKRLVSVRRVKPNAVVVLDLATGEENLRLEGHAAALTCFAFRPDGKEIASADMAGTVKVWDTVTGLELRTFWPGPGGANGLAVSPDGKTLATCRQSLPLGPGPHGSLRLWDAETARLLHDLKGFKEGVTCVAFSPDGKRLISGGGAIDKGEICVWDVATGKRLRAIPAHEGTVVRVAPSPDGERLATTAIGERSVKVWHLPTGREIGTLPTQGKAFGVAYHPSGLFLASSGSPRLSESRGEVILWDLRTQRALHRMSGHNSIVFGVAFSPDGARLASAGWDGIVRVWDTRNGQEILDFKADPKTLSSPAFSPGGTLVAAAGREGTIRLWKGPPSRAEVQLRYPIGPGGWSTWAAARTGGRTQAAREDDGSVRVWDTPTRRPVLNLRPDGVYRAVCYALDADRLAVVRGGGSGRFGRLGRVGLAFEAAG